jgi:hypothetical protein
MTVLAVAAAVSAAVCGVVDAVADIERLRLGRR